MTRLVTSFATVAVLAVALSGCSFGANSQDQACKDFETAWSAMKSSIDTNLPKVTEDSAAWGKLSDARDAFVSAAHEVGNGQIDPLSSTTAERVGTLVDAARLYKQKPSDGTQAALDTAQENLSDTVAKIDAICK
ncbi:hypothetical protein [Plantibacter sp. YIM 135249]|jgi:hypothetical protein|uniref:hypothetical protein n=1 Tax=Plantibacter sp. YIM 135249 TaxID=3423918 RepID=UPI003D33D78E